MYSLAVNLARDWNRRKARHNAKLYLLWHEAAARHYDEGENGGLENRQDVQLVVYNKEKKDKARETALNLRALLLGQLDPKNEVLIMVSWFDAAETLPSGYSDSFQLSPSVLIFSNPLKEATRRNAI